MNGGFHLLSTARTSTAFLFGLFSTVVFDFLVVLLLVVIEVVLLIVSAVVLEVVVVVILGIVVSKKDFDQYLIQTSDKAKLKLKEVP